MLWHRTKDRGSSPLPTHSEYFNFKQHAARLTKKREQGMFIDRCSGTRGIWLQRGVRYPLAISLRLPLSHPNVSLMCAYVYVYMYICVCVCMAFLIFHVHALRWMKHPTRFFNHVRNYVELSVLYTKISSISWRGTIAYSATFLPVHSRIRIVSALYSQECASRTYVLCIAVDIYVRQRRLPIRKCTVG